MSEHDPMCMDFERGGLIVIYDGKAGGSDHIDCLTCYIVARVREDERDLCEHHTHDSYVLGYSEGQRDEREACTEAVDAQTPLWAGDTLMRLGLQTAIAAIRARGEKQFRFATKVECVHQFEVFDQIDGGKHSKCVLCGFKEKP